MTVPLAYRQLLARRGRSIAGLAGIAVALLLVLALNAIFAGMQQRLTAYIERSGADVIVAQRGVDTMHMTESALPEPEVAAIRAVPGVADVRPILYAPILIERGDDRALVYLIGDDDGGAPVAVRRGRRPASGEILLDGVAARKLQVAPGATVRVLAQDFRVSGEVEGLASITNAVAFVPRGDLGRLLGVDGVVSYVFVRGRRGVALDDLTARIERAVPTATASTRRAFVRSERRVVGDMSTDIVRGMTLIGFIVGVAVAALVAYSSMVAQLRDYAVLRALGLRTRRALALVVGQVGALVLAGFAAALGLALLLAATSTRLASTLVLVLRPGDVARALLVAGLVAIAAAALPIVRIARVDPASVFRR
jgi:putative ABC transport system permease protein